MAARQISMKKWIVISLSIGTLFLLGIVYVLLSSSKPTVPTLLFSPTPSPIPNSPQNGNSPISVVSTNPINNAQEVSPTSPISFTFSQDIKASDFSITLTPEFTHTILASKNTLTIIPQEQLQPNAAYLIQIQARAGGFVSSLSFSTTTDTSKPQQDNAADIEDQLAKQYHPDIYLANRCPYHGSDFSVDYTTNTQDGLFAFTVTLSGANKNTDKEDFTKWIQSIGLSTSQLDALDITYQ